MASEKIFGFYGHHKCATTWVRNIIRDVCSITNSNMAVFDRAEQFGGELPKKLAEDGIDFFVYSNADIRHLENMPEHRAFHLIRDPRDILVSAYFSHLKSHPVEGWPELSEHRRELERMSQEDGIILQLDFIANVFEEIGLWDYNQEHVLEYKYEDMVVSSYDFILNAVRFIGLLDEEDCGVTTRCALAVNSFCHWLKLRSKGISPLYLSLDKVPAEELAAIVCRRRFSKLAGGRKEGVEDKSSHYRKGVPGDWKNYFEPKVEEAFKERHGELLIRLGYETSEDW